ncbi:MAG: ATP-grasp domain-containing protein [Candidatus Marinimicrobia bacterium]|nr:ATP-grasp domain-containing protein [Candidatus Neomarinimicrobiota bacterium]
MFLIDGPYVSVYLKETLQSLQIPVVKTASAESYLKDYRINYLSEAAAVSSLIHEPQTQLYMNSENALDWLYQKLPESSLVKTAQKVKDKLRFRELLAEIHPDYFFRGYSRSELSSVNPQHLPYPLILKPSVGFFSLGVHSIENAEQWKRILNELDQVINSSENIYPIGVLDNSTFILESVIPGEEFAIDCYYDDSGKVVMLNMMRHLFASEADVNDRVYITSAALIREYREPIERYLSRLGDCFGLNNFPAHVELRIDGDNSVMAIEINPLRFGGWCSTADLAFYAWDMNLYEILDKKSRPDWDKLVRRSPEKGYALIVLNNSTGTSGGDITSFNYDALLETVKTPLELRKTDFKKFPVFGFLMCSFPVDNLEELYQLLHSDLKEFIVS